MPYSLWLRPSEQQATRLKRTIEQFARAQGTTIFEPHVTVISGISMRPNTKILTELASRHPKHSLAAIRVDDSSKHHQCLTLALKRERKLAELRADALRTLGSNNGYAAYNPHISLLYAKLAAKRRAQLAKQIPAELLQRTTGAKLQLVSTTGHERQWQVIEEVELPVKHQ